MSDLINPATRIGPLLDAHPELEEVLIEISGEFRRLRNPLLRRTVAKVATLEQVAKVGQVPLHALLARLRQALGQSSPGAESEGSRVETAPTPPWVAEARSPSTLSAEEILAGGRTPLAVVSELLAAAAPGEVVLLVAPFHPAPLVDAVLAKGYEVYARPVAAGWEVWVRT